MLVRVEPRERRQRHPRSAEALQHGPVEAVVPRLADRLAPDDDSERALVTQQAADVNDAVLCVAMGSSRRVQVRPAGAGAARRVQVRPAGAGWAGGYAYNYIRRSHVEDAIVLHVLRELLPGLAHSVTMAGSTLRMSSIDRESNLIFPSCTSVGRLEEAPDASRPSVAALGSSGVISPRASARWSWVAELGASAQASAQLDPRICADGSS